MRACGMCQCEITRHSKTGLCGSCAIRVRTEMNAKGLSRPGGPSASEVLEYLRAARGEVKVEAPLRPAASNVLDIARQTQSVIDWNANVVTLKADRVVVSSDLHIPRHDPDALHRVGKLGIAYGADAYVAGGDLLDFEDLSSYPQPGPGGPDALDSLGRALSIIEALLDIFPKVLVLGGNHDVIRFLKQMDKRERAMAGSSRSLARLLGEDGRHYEDRYRAAMMGETMVRLGLAAERVTWMPETHMYIEGPSGRVTAVYHQRKYSRRPPWEGLDIWQNESARCSVICTHTHGVGQARTPDGKSWLMNIGCGTRREWHQYATRHTMGLPEWSRAVALVSDGEPELFCVDDHARKWAEVDALCSQREREVR